MGCFCNFEPKSAWLVVNACICTEADLRCHENNHRDPKQMSEYSLGFVAASSGGEPDLASVCRNDSDRVTLRNIIYTLWATNKPVGNTSSEGAAAGSANCYLVCIRVSVWHMKIE